jgi:hypothetical protein
VFTRENCHRDHAVDSLGSVNRLSHRRGAADRDWHGQDVSPSFASGMNLSQFGLNMKAAAIRYDGKTTSACIDFDMSLLLIV